MKSFAYQVSQGERISREQLDELSEIKAWRFNLALISDISLIAVSIAISEYFWFNPYVYVASVIVIGSRMHGFGILVHETVHSLAYKNRKANLCVGEVLAWTLGVSMSGYRFNHYLHHRKTNSDDDPDWIRNKNFFHQYPKTRLQNFLCALLMLSGCLYFYIVFFLNRDFSRYKYNKLIEVCRLIFYAAVIASAIIFDFTLGLMVYWLIPLMTFFFFLLAYRGMAEHHGNLDYSDIYKSTRTVHANWFEKFFLAQHNVEYHLDHHLYPQVPFYNLPRLHEVLMQKPVYREKAHITDGYLKGLVNEITV